jgi:predicted PurR-regulated permease PerM
MSLLIFDVKYALILAIIAGLLEAIPYFGPTLSSIPAIFIAGTQSPLLALFILFVYIVIQAVENNILVPKIMQRAVGLDPIISIISLMIGFKLGGILGALLAIPVATSLSVIIKDLFLNYEKKLS